MACAAADALSGDKDNAALRKGLSHLLDEACLFLRKSTSISRQFQDQTILNILADKQEHARSKCIGVVKELFQQLAHLQHSLEVDINQAMSGKEEQLAREYDNIMMAMKQVVKDCNIIEEMLEKNHSTLAQDAPQLINHLKKTMTFDPEDSLKSVLTLDFIPNVDAVQNCFRDNSKFGFFQTSHLNPSEARLVNCQNKAFVSIEDILCLKVAEKPHKDCLQYLNVTVEGPQGEKVEVSCHDNQDGTVTLQYTPLLIGAHLLNIRIYGAHIVGSPVPINVMEVLSETDSVASREESVTAKKKQVNRSFLCELTRHITEQPPPKQYKTVSTARAQAENADELRECLRYRDTTKSAKIRCKSHMPTRSDAKSWRKKDEDAGSTDDNEADMYPRRKSRAHSVDTIDSTPDWKGSGEPGTIEKFANVDTIPAQKSDPIHEKDLVDMERSVSRDYQTFEDSSKVPQAKVKSIMPCQPIVIQPESDLQKNIPISSLAMFLKKEPASPIFLQSPTSKPRRVLTSESKPGKLPSKYEHNVSTEKETTCMSIVANIEVVEKSLVPDITYVRGHTEPPSKKGAESTLKTEIPRKETSSEDGSSASSTKKTVAEVLQNSVGQKIRPPSLSTAHAGDEMPGQSMSVTSIPLPDGDHTSIIPLDMNNNVKASSEHKVDHAEEKVKPLEIPAVKFLSWQPIIGVSSGEGSDNKSVKEESVQKESEYDPQIPDAVSKCEEAKKGHDVPSTSSASPSLQQLVSIDALPSYPSQWKNMEISHNIVAKYITRRHYVEGLPTHAHVQTIASHKDGPGSIKFPIGVTVNQMTKDIVLCNQGADNVKLYDWNGQHKLTLGEGKGGVEFNRPSAVVTDSQGQIFVKDDKSLQSFSKEGRHIRTFGSDVLMKPYGLTFTPYGRLLTVDPRRKSILTFDPSGNDHEEYPFQPCLLNDRSSKLRFLAVHGESLVVSDLGLSQIYLSSTLGGNYNLFGRYGKDFGDFNEPSGVTMDGFGNMLIADSKNERIHIYNPYGEFAGFISLSARIRRPSDIHLTKDGSHLLVSNLLGHCVTIFKLLEV